jgi:cytolysin-activating lysine-acyltransferase
MTDTATELQPTLPVEGAMIAEQATEFSAQLQTHARRVTGKLPLLGAVIWLMLQHNSTRHTLVSDAEWRVMPPLVLNQAKLYMRDDAPIAYVSWAMLSDRVAERYCLAPHQLAAGDWQSGEQVWIVDLYAPFGGADHVIQDLHNTVLKGRVIHHLAMGGTDKLVPTVFRPE